MHLVLIETSGNQNYIFATNKLRENVGASELTYQIGTKYVLQAIGKEDVVKNDTNGSKLRDFLLNDKQNPFKDSEGHTIEVIVATSGKALLLVDDEGKAKKIVSEITKNALLEIPGLTVHGAIEIVKDDLSDIHDAVGKVHRRLETLRYKIPSNQQRFLRLPHVEPCATSGLPAARVYRHESLKNKPEEAKPHSSLSIEKQEKSNEGRDRLEKTIQSVKPNVKLVGNINELEQKFKETRWLAIIHADGNGLGEIFLNFANYLNHLNIGRNTDAKKTFKKLEDARKYIDAYRTFSIALDICTINATGVAIENFQNCYRAEYKKRNGKDTDKLPFIPLILGGDDLTVLCDGEYALKFTHDFLAEFETQVSANETIWKVANNAFGNKDEHSPAIKRLGICAGVAIVKPHYPFHQAYELAEQLLKSAKQVKTKVKHKPANEEVQLPCSALDFHVLYDSSGVDLNEIRERLKVDEDKTYLYAKPYIVTPNDALKKNLEFKDEKFTNEWLNQRTWNNLAIRVCAMSQTEDEKRKLPNSQMHHIRESLHRGQQETDSEVDLFKHRYSSNDPKKDKGFGKLLCDGDSLFFSEKHKKDGAEVDRHTTHFLDALDVVEFWKGFDCKANGEVDENAENGGKQ